MNNLSYYKELQGVMTQFEPLTEAALQKVVSAISKCQFSPKRNVFLLGGIQVLSSLIHHITCRLEARQALIYQLALGLTGENGPPPSRPTDLTDVTSEQVMQLMPTMTAKDVIELLGDTQDVGSGLLILCYRVDGAYTLNIPFATLHAQLGVTGEQLLQAKQPIEN